MTQRHDDKIARSARSSGQLIMSPAGIGLLIQRQLLHPPVFAALASIQSGNTGRVRMVVVRDFDIRTMTLQTSADVRSAKVAQLRKHQKSELCLWLPELRTQLRLLANWRVISGEAAEHSKRDLVIRNKLWQHHRPESRHLFTGAQPGRPVAIHRHEARIPAASANFPDEEPSEYFAVLIGRIISIDALYLAATGHHRYRHRLIGDRWETLKINP
jgi:hypothetical protein